MNFTVKSLSNYQKKKLKYTCRLIYIEFQLSTRYFYTNISRIFGIDVTVKITHENYRKFIDHTDYIFLRIERLANSGNSFDPALSAKITAGCLDNAQKMQPTHMHRSLYIRPRWQNCFFITLKHPLDNKLSTFHPRSHPEAKIRRKKKKREQHGYVPTHTTTSYTHIRTCTQRKNTAKEKEREMQRGNAFKYDKQYWKGKRMAQRAELRRVLQPALKQSSARARRGSARNSPTGAEAQRKKELRAFH